MELHGPSIRAARAPWRSTCATVLRFGAVIGALTAATVTAAAATQPSLLVSQPEPEEQVWRLLRPSGSDSLPDVDELGQRVHDLGQEALPVVVDILCGDVLDPRTVEAEEGDGKSVTHTLPQTREHQRQALLAALERWPAGERLQVLVERGRSGELGQKLVALDLIGDVARSEAVPGLFEVLGSVEPLHFRSPNHSGRMVTALTRVLRADPHSYAALEDELLELAPGALQVVIAALGEAGSRRALALLPELAGRGRDSDLCLLRTLGEVGQTTTHEPPAAMADLMRSMLYCEDTQVARTAAVALSQANDLESVPLLIPMLADEDPKLAQSAHWSLKHMSGLDLRPEPDAWSAWFERESAWFRDESPALFEALESEDMAKLGGALVQLGAHRLYRHEIAASVGPMLESEDPNTVRAAAAALERLDSPRAIPWLVHALDLAEDQEQRELLTSTLRSLTGLQLPPEGAAWLATLPD